MLKKSLRSLRLCVLNHKRVSFQNTQIDMTEQLFHKSQSWFINADVPIFSSILDI